MFTPNLKMYVISFDDGTIQKVIAQGITIIHNKVRLRIDGLIKEFDVSKVSEFWEDTLVKRSELSSDSELSVKSLLAKEKV